MEELKELLGKIPDAKIAEITGLPLAEVASQREELGLPEPKAEEPTPPPAPESPPAPKKDSKPRPPKREEPKAEEPTPPPAPESPTHVKVVKSARVVRPGSGRTWRLGKGDVYKGEDAAHLWAHHRDLVRPFES